MTQHTPGPWKRDGDCLVTVQTDEVVAFVNPDESPNHIADSRLIAAAPMLLEALEGTAHKLEIIYKANKDQLSLGDIEILMDARAAIRAAKGESNG